MSLLIDDTLTAVSHIALSRRKAIRKPAMPTLLRRRWDDCIFSRRVINVGAPMKKRAVHT